LRSVLDTNVIVSGIFFGGLPAEILRAWEERRFELVISADILAEYDRIAELAVARSADLDIQEILDRLVTGALAITAAPLPEPVCSDPDDDKFLACAIAAGAPVVVSGDRALQAADSYCGLRVLSPTAFVRLHL
jgi:putative PIN family toxin of toxin-antitoxin system